MTRLAPWSLAARLGAALLLMAALSLGLFRLLSSHGWVALVLAVRQALGLPQGLVQPWSSGHALLLSLLLLLPLAWLLSSWALRPLQRVMRALQGTVASYRDGDFSFSLVESTSAELKQLVRLHNDLGHTLREQRQALVQRELMLDTVVQNTPVALVLSDSNDRIAYANMAARHLFLQGSSLHGQALTPILQRLPPALLETVRRSEDALLPLTIGDQDEVFHISMRNFRLQGRSYRLHLFRRMTRELSREEVNTWKRLIRVISHELNNSLAPISSLAHSGAELARRGEVDRLPAVLASIGERARHLHGFIDGYASFARLPAPRLEPVPWAPFFESLSLQAHFSLASEVPAQPGWFDPVQMEQVLINLLKNAHEASGEEAEVELLVWSTAVQLRLEIRDRGPGMSEAVLAQALLPFYSTKRSGTGLGLALAREIVEAHGGRISLANRDGGGLRVQLILPPSAATPGG